MVDFACMYSIRKAVPRVRDVSSELRRCPRENGSGESILSVAILTVAIKVLTRSMNSVY